MALWGTGRWDIAKWTEQVGYMAATETGVDVFSAEGDVVVAGTMAATETQVDTFAATGTVTITGQMAAVETETDTFAAEGDVQVVGLMAATESTTDTFAAEGDVQLAGTMAATETGVDVFSADGDVEIAGTMAALETGVDVFAAEGDVGNAGTMAAVETEVDVFAATGKVTPVNPDVLPIGDIGPGDEKRRRKRTKERDALFEKERRDREALRDVIQRAIDPVVEKAAPAVISEGTKSIQVLAVDGSRVGIPVPAAFNPAQVAEMVADALKAAQIQAEHVKRRADAERALAMARAHLQQIIRRKRNDEFLMLVD